MQTLLQAARASDLESVQAILDRQPESIGSVNGYGFNALHEALMADTCGNVNFELIKLLVAAGCPINQRSKDGRSPLWIAAEFCPHVEIIQYLIEHGASAESLEHDTINILTCLYEPLPEIQKLLSQFTGKSIPEPPPPPKYPDQRADTATWRKTTSALKKVFAELQKHNIVALSNPSYTRDECIAECWEYHETQKNAEQWATFCFYNETGKQRARENGELNIYYGYFEEEISLQEITKLAEKIMATFNQYHFEAEWNGNPDSCIIVWLQPFYAHIQAA